MTLAVDKFMEGGFPGPDLSKGSHHQPTKKSNGQVSVFPQEPTQKADKGEKAGDCTQNHDKEREDVSVIQGVQYKFVFSHEDKNERA